MAQGVHRALAGGTLAGVVGGDDRIVLDTDDGHPIGGRSKVAVAGLGHVPAGIRTRALAARTPLGWMDTREGNTDRGPLNQHLVIVAKQVVLPIKTSPVNLSGRPRKYDALF
jgi:hypothetical protein